MRTVLRCLSGSRAYGTNHSESDEDWIIGEVLDHSYYIGLDRMKTDGRSNKESDGNDAYHCEIVKLISLLVKFNPNMIVGLYSPRIEVTDNWKWIIANRQWFTSKAGINTFLGFASNNLERGIKGDSSGKLGEKGKALIDKYGWNTTHGYHTIRVARMLKEFLECDGSTLNVQRADAADLLDIRHGKRSLKSVIEEFDDLKSGVRLLEKTANIPDEPNLEEIDDALQWSLGWELRNRTAESLQPYRSGFLTQKP